MSITIRPYQKKDRLDLLACINHLQEYEKSLEPELKNSGASVASSFLDFYVREDSANSGKLLVAEVDGRVAGFVNGYLDEDDGADDLVVRRWFYLSDIAVLPAFQGQNIGSQLIAAIENHARSLNLTQIKLDVLSRNAAAKSFYAKHGYRDYEQVVYKDISENNRSVQSSD